MRRVNGAQPAKISSLRPNAVNWQIVQHFTVGLLLIITAIFHVRSLGLDVKARECQDALKSDYLSPKTSALISTVHMLRKMNPEQAARTHIEIFEVPTTRLIARLRSGRQHFSRASAKTAALEALIAEGDAHFRTKSLTYRFTHLWVFRVALALSGISARDFMEWPLISSEDLFRQKLAGSDLEIIGLRLGPVFSKVVLSEFNEKLDLFPDVFYLPAVDTFDEMDSIWSIEQYIDVDGEKISPLAVPLKGGYIDGAFYPTIADVLSHDISHGGFAYSNFEFFKFSFRSNFQYDRFPQIVRIDAGNFLKSFKQSWMSEFRKVNDPQTQWAAMYIYWYIHHETNPFGLIQEWLLGQNLSYLDKVRLFRRLRHRRDQYGMLPENLRSASESEIRAVIESGVAVYVSALTAFRASLSRTE